jgi:crotonobetainyl-CoA:carnitine CoA-transferase CaiB-like acyl-CoA transferase
VLVTDLDADEVVAMRLLEPRDEDDRLVRVSITPFGLSGPYRDHRATASTLLALGGYTYLSGDPGRAPLTFPGRYPYYQAGTFAYITALASYLHTLEGGEPAPVEIAVFEVVSTLHQFTDVMWTHQGRVRQRHGNRWENLVPTTMVRLADGWGALNVILPFWEAFTHMLGKPELATHPDWATDAERLKRYVEMDRMLVEAFGEWTRERFLHEGQEVWRVPVGVVLSMAEVLEDRHLSERGFWRPLEDDTRDLRVPGSPFRFVGEPLPPEHAPSAPTGDLPPLAPRARPEAPGILDGRTPHRPLEGLRVVDLTRIWSGPLATRTLGDLGADVIKVEAPTGRGPSAVPKNATGYWADDDPGDRPWLRNGLNNKLNRNKRSLAIDLKHPEGREALLALVARADLVIENFSARAMPSLGLGYEQLREVNPRIIYVAMPAYGLTGPYREYVGLGPSIEPLTGMTSLMGYGPDEPRMSVQAITDAMSGTMAASAVLTALERRARTGEGAFIELSQAEGGTAYFGEQVIERQLTGREPERTGNAHPRHAPWGVYRCAGDDAWVAIAVEDDAGWEAFCDIAGTDWASRTEFATLEARLAHRDALDAAVEGWTSGQQAAGAMQALQAVGVAAAVVNAAPQWLSDPHLHARHYFFTTEELGTGQRTYDGFPVTWHTRELREGRSEALGSGRGYDQWRRSPGLGEHNREVLASAGLEGDAVDALESAGVIVDRPPS